MVKANGIEGKLVFPALGADFVVDREMSVKFLIVFNYLLFDFGSHPFRHIFLKNIDFSRNI